MTEALRSSETSVLTRATLRNIPQDGILKVIPSLKVQDWQVDRLYGECACRILLSLLNYMNLSQVHVIGSR
jgi:hypothetical protein